jgi:hypothetical protein
MKYTSKQPTNKKSTQEKCFLVSYHAQAVSQRNDLSSFKHNELKQISLISLPGNNFGLDTEEYTEINDKVSVSTPPIRVTRSEIFGEDPPTPSSPRQDRVHMKMMENCIHMKFAENIYHGMMSPDLTNIRCDQSSEMSDGTESSFSSNDIPEFIEIKLDHQQKLNLLCSQRHSL